MPMLHVIIIILFIVFFLIPFLAGFFGNAKILSLYNVDYKTIKPAETETIEETEIDENKQERIQLQENTLVQYNKLLDTLSEQIKTETDTKKRSALLRQQITTLEKYNKALEKLEKLNGG